MKSISFSFFSAVTDIIVLWIGPLTDIGSAIALALVVLNLTSRCPRKLGKKILRTNITPGVGFEPTRARKAHRLSRPAP